MFWRAVHPKGCSTRQAASTDAALSAACHACRSLRCVDSDDAVRYRKEMMQQEGVQENALKSSLSLSISTEPIIDIA